MKKYFNLKVLLLAVGAFALFQNVDAQRIALKSNALLWATASPNVGAEFRVSRRFTVSTDVAFNPFKFGNLDLHYGAFQPEVRYWFSGRPHARWYVGVAGLASVYNMCISNTRHDGSAFGGGVTGGYSFVLGERWGIEATLGIGALSVAERKYALGQPSPGICNNEKIMIAPIKAGVTFVYLLK